MNKIILNKGKDKAAWQLHPWVFSGAISAALGKPQNGDIVSVYNIEDEFIAYGIYNGNSRVAVRLLEWDPSQEINEQWWRNRVSKSVNNRLSLLHDTNNTVRLIFAEADFLPGLIADKYADFISVQVHSAGIEKVKDIIVDQLVQLLQPKGIYERSDLKSREYEGLPDTNGILYGAVPPEFVDVIENGIHYQVNIVEGQKSGFYCDQRENRAITARYTKDKTVLDCFSYSGGFTLNAFREGAKSITSVDSSGLAIETLKNNIKLNGFDSSKHTAVQSDVNKYLRELGEQGEKFDVIVLDPPKYAPTRSALEKASRAYKDLNRRGLMLLNSGGLLATFSCSGAMDIDTFKQVIAWAALDAGKEIQFIYQYCQPEDHPVRASFPESEYLKGLLVRVL
ncbi:ribosomal RNA large subunit methyltransferase I [Sphingobacterium mizutaii NBRC 14946 = DSM 11724]|uniref:Ribosomal RNA large subunit methyltransferase I n=2 Tax=Sphingobacterium mizutaii TaxID=1010 RepID=A0AAJ4X998_9SPHI|nr:class I SAM-dependent rRNA methyltransferase [Sphingobacterium mizutaii]GEM67471.1 ribosomal RNA large subunit methyltransferase I [Sphingobacterium mizutaii NBRC 14946 = DSM 11724]SDL39362.1 23S rRNA (cytosine1962-C5)-methyltransferase [Sphingobacterium mizutaii]SNV44031.1 Ribosomal RNA large subunit methyltransferase I [Sphingobacterium mizutaii]